MADSISIVLGVLRLFSGVVSNITSLLKRSGDAASPFEVVPLEDLLRKLPSPLRFTPRRIPRSFTLRTEPGMHLLGGPSGVGKTREAAELIQTLAPISGAGAIYLARGYVEATAPLPRSADVRRVIVLIDDYDFRFAPAAALSFGDRQAGFVAGIANLRRLYRRMRSLVELHAFVVTLNTHRLPISASELSEILPECSCYVVPAVTQAESRVFIIAVSQCLGSQITDEAADILATASDGRFDIIATFLAGFRAGTVIAKPDMERYWQVPSYDMGDFHIRSF